MVKHADSQAQKEILHQETKARPHLTLLRGTVTSTRGREQADKKGQPLWRHITGTTATGADRKNPYLLPTGKRSS